MTEWHEECDRYRTCAECPRRDLCDVEDEAEKLLRDEQARYNRLLERVERVENDLAALWDWFRKTEDRTDRMVAAIVRIAEEEDQ